MKCLKCNAPLREQSYIDYITLEWKRNVKPIQGAVSVCYNCGCLCKFNAVSDLVTMTDTEENKLQKEEPILYDFLKKTQYFILNEYRRLN